MSRKTNVQIVYSYYHPEITAGSELDVTALWEGQVHKKPREGGVYSVAEGLDADVAMTFYHAPRTGDSYASDLYLVDVYVFDLAYERMYHGRGNERDYKSVTSRQFDKLLSDRKKSDSPRMAGGVGVATVPSMESASVSTASGGIEQVPIYDAYRPVERREGTDEIPMQVGIYFDSELRDFKYQESSPGSNTLEIPVGAASVAHFEQVFKAVFEGAWVVEQRPPYAVTDIDSNWSAVIEVRIEKFAWNPGASGPSSADVTYRFIVYSPSGNIVSSWTGSGSDIADARSAHDPLVSVGTQVGKAIRIASSRFMSGFQNRREIQSWLAAVVPKQNDLQKQLEKDLEGTTIRATLYSQHAEGTRPYNSAAVPSEILAARIVIQNVGSHSILVRPSNITLIPGEGVSLEPVSADRAAARLRESGEPGLDGNVGLGILMLSMIDSAITASDRQTEIEREIEFFRSRQLNNSTVAPGESISGFVYFEALGADAIFYEAELKIPLGTTASTRNFDATLLVGQVTAVFSAAQRN